LPITDFEERSVLSELNAFSLGCELTNSPYDHDDTAYDRGGATYGSDAVACDKG